MGISVVVAVFRAHVVSPAASIESETRPLRGRSDECRYVTKRTYAFFPVMTFEPGDWWLDGWE